ncbi:PREDICTED: putative pectinesterase/pectinesterase inhibitor 26 [Nicotiana attenuata]|uniref:Pectinesterasepectinesterase inhibitor 26 n=1 Tax=Nicotiana attenuata TaxID=49451 RepID=A0A314KXU0_NICAT|nr:PREDICTED: putative pectinesterase/pectinesterase inhibitor 26 [Nicotiana attenuata]OIT34226.1 putative pectinesterasepectinesterase inhibitor 26 [Nicotiana attenuata]
MEIDTANSTISNSSVRDSLLVEQDQTSRRKKKLKFIIILLIVFTFIIGAIISVFTTMKQDFESKSPAKNPTMAIRSICSLTQYPTTCFKSLSPIYKNNPSSKINASRIFSFSFHTAIDELNKLSTLLSESNDRSLKHCESMFNDSVRQLNSYLATLDVNFRNELSFVVSKSLRELMGWLYRETPKLEVCLNKLRFEYMLSSRRVLSNSLTILSNMESVSEMFYPIIGSDQSMVASFLSNVQFVDTLCIFGVQYILLVFLFCLLLRLL